MITSSLSLGTSGLGIDTQPGSDSEVRAIEVAVDLLTTSERLIDTSNMYSGGRSEAVLGAAIAASGVDASARIVSKVDSDPETAAFDRDRVLRSFDESARRLGMDRLPILHLHDPYGITFEEAVGPHGAVAGLIELRQSGCVDAIGVAAGPVPLMARYVATGVFDAVLIHNRFTIVDQSAAPVFADAKNRGMTVFNAAPFGASILATGPRPGATYAYRPASAELLDWVGAITDLCGRYGVSVPAAALHFSLRSPLIDSTVVGVSSPGRRAQLDALVTSEIPDDLWSELDSMRPAPSPIHDGSPV